MTRYTLIGDLREGRTIARPQHIRFPRLEGFLADVENDYRGYHLLYRHAGQIIPTRCWLLVAPRDPQLCRYRNILGRTPFGVSHKN